MTLKWLGTAGFEVETSNKRILIDPFFTRTPLKQLAFRTLRPSIEEIKKYIPDSADAIIVGHSHYDHALDVPEIAKLTGATVIGSSSTANLMRSSGLDESKIKTVTGGDVVEIGSMRIKFHSSVHSRIFFGRVPSPGEISPQKKLPMRGKDYRCGEVFGIEIETDSKTLFHQGSADLVEKNYGTAYADVLLMGISGRQFSDRYIPRMLEVLKPTTVIVHHFDNFFRPLDKPMKYVPRVNVTGAINKIKEFSPEIEVIVPKLLEPISL